MQVWYRDGTQFLIALREPHVYTTEGELCAFLRAYLMDEKRELLLVFSGAEEKILEEKTVLKPHLGRRPEHYLDNMVLSLLRADGVPVRPHLAEGRVAIECNFKF